MYRFNPDQNEILSTWTPSQRFWLHSWLELLHEFSASPYRVRPIPLSAVAAELVDLIALWKAGKIAVPAVDDVRSELLHIVKGDPILPRTWPEERSVFLGALGSAITPKSDIRRMAWCATQLSTPRFANSYRARLIEQLEALINNPAPDQRLIDIRVLSERLIAELLWFGYSEARLFRGAMATLGEDDPTVAISATLRGFHGPSRQYECDFRLDGLNSHLPHAFDFAGVSFVAELAPHPKGDTNFYERHHKRRFATVAVEALDPYAAADQAGILLRRAADALVFAAPLQSPHTYRTAYIRGAERLWEINLFDTAVFGRLPKGVKRINRFRGLFESLSRRDDVPSVEAITIALHWYTAALSSAALDLERTFLSLWIGLEYLIAGHGRADYTEPTGIVVPIKRYLPRVSALYLPNLLVRDFTNYVYRLVQNGDLPEEGALAGRLPGPRRYVNEHEMVEYLLDASWTEAISTSQCDDVLFLQRLHWMRDQFQAGEAILELMREHVAEAERDIAHLYRVRNNIAHGGAFGRQLPLLRYGIRTAHEYLSIMIESLLFHVRNDPTLNVADVLLSAEATYDSLQRCSKPPVTDLLTSRPLFIGAG